MADFDWYRSFVAVYRVGTVTGAAAERNLTQPAVTQHLAALESAVGEPLFVRSPRRMLPTERGNALYTQVAEALEALEGVSQRLRSPLREARPLVRLGAPREYFADVALTRLHAVDVRLRVQFGTARVLLDGLQRGDLDVVIATERLSMRELDYQKLAEERFILVCGVQFTPPVVEPTTAAQRATLEAWLLDQAWLSYGSDLPIIRRFWRQVFARRPVLEPTLIIPDLGVIARAVVLGYGVSVLPAYLCQQAIAAGELQMIWAPDDVAVTNDLWLAHARRDRQRREVVDTLAALHGS